MADGGVIEAGKQLALIDVRGLVTPPYAKGHKVKGRPCTVCQVANSDPDRLHIDAVGTTVAPRHEQITTHACARSARARARIHRQVLGKWPPDAARISHLPDVDHDLFIDSGRRV